MTNETTITDVPEASVSQPQQRGRIVRSRDDRIIAGVASGIARHFDVDPWLVRIVAIVLIVFGGAGLLLYGAGWLLLPEEGEDETIAERWLGDLRGSSTWIGVALILLAGVWIVSATGVVSAGLAWAVGLLVLGVLLYQGSIPRGAAPGRGRRGPDPSGDAGEVTSAVSAPLAPVAPNAGEGDDEPPVEPRPAVEPTAPKAPRRRRRRSVLGRLTIGTMFLVVGIMALLDATGAARPAFRHYVVAAVLVVGLGLIVGAFAGRSRGLVVLGVLLMPLLIASAAVTAPFTGGFGDPVHRPSSIAEIASPYRLAAGDMTLDLGSLGLVEGDSLQVEATVGAGRLLVLVPSGMGVEIRAHAGFGQVALFGGTDDGIDVDRRLTRGGSSTVVLDLDVGFGQVEVAGTVTRSG